MSRPTVDRHQVGSVELSTATWGAGPPEIVLLHDGLGSVGQWGQVPGRVAHATGRTVMAYDRAGHGSSTPTPTGAWPADWLHREADILDSLLAQVGASNACVVGHSDGGTIAAIRSMGGAEAAALILLAAHSWVEPVCTEEITRLALRRDRISASLRHHHEHPIALVDAWVGVWLSDDFANWDIRPQLAAITCPTLVVQGKADEYATDEQARATAAAIGPSASCNLLDGVGHLLHHEDEELIVDTIVRFLRSVP